MPCSLDHVLTIWIQRVVLLEAWKVLESSEGDAASLAKVEAMLPRVVKKMRKVDGDASMMEECTSLPPLSSFPVLTSGWVDYDMIFADDETAASNPASLKFLELAHAWKMKAAAMAAAAEANASQDDDDDDDEESDEEEEEETAE